jgi:hypothetical protein
MRGKGAIMEKNERGKTERGRNKRERDEISER